MKWESMTVLPDWAGTLCWLLGLYPNCVKPFKIDLPIKALFDAPTVAELSSYIKKLLIAEIEALTDEEARQLVSKGHV